VAALCACQLAALCLLWIQWWHSPPAALPAWFLSAATAWLGAWAVSQWPAWWRAAGYRLAGMAPVPAAMPGGCSRLWIRVSGPDGRESEAVVRDSWKLGEAVTLLALSDAWGRAPRVLAVTARDGGTAAGRALQRALRAGHRARPGVERAGQDRRAGR
jgi:hypothetical protein